MGITTSQQIQKYYELYKENDLTFTKEVTNALNLLPKHVFFKCIGSQWACLICSASMTGARLFATLNETFYEQIKRSGNIIQIRFAFKREDKSDPLTFYISAKISGFTPYGKSDKDINFITAVYTQKPPDSFIEIIGSLLDATTDSQKRKEERIFITADIARHLNLNLKESIIDIEQVPRKCLIRDLSYSGAKVILIGIAKYLINKPAHLKIWFEDGKEPIDISGTILRDEEVSGRKDVTALAMKFDEEHVPIEYKMRINQYLKHPVKTTAKPKSSAPAPGKIENHHDEPH
jgi:hypothetical protein